MVTISTADNVLKSYYLDTVTQQLDLKINPFFSKIKKNSRDVWGKDVRKVVRYGMNGGIGAGTEEGALPASGSNNYETFVAPLKNLYGTIEISDKAIRAANGNEGAFVNLLNDEMDNLVQSASFNFGRMLFGDGSGKLLRIASVSGDIYTVNTTRNVFEGMIVDVYSLGGKILASGRTILNVDRVLNKVTLSGDSIADVSGGIMTLQGSYNMEITGLEKLFDEDSETLYGVSKAGKSWLNPVHEMDVGEISETIIQTTIDELEERANSKVDLIICSWGVKRALAELFASKRTFDTVDLECGTRAILFNGIPVVADRFCPSGTMYLLNTEDFCLHQLCDWQWLENEDGRILKQKPGQAVYTATLVKYAELICNRPCGQAKLSGINEA